MDFTRREIATIAMVIGIVVVCIGAWMQHRRQYQLMPSLVSPMGLMVFGGALGMIAFVVLILPSR